MDGKFEVVHQNCQKENKLFIDLDFPSIDKSISENKKFFQKFNKIIWKKSPGNKFISYEKIFIKQGYLGNCYFISSLNSIIQNPKLLSKIIGPFSEEFGMFSFNFYRNKWINVIVDDSIPFENEEPIFCSTDSTNDKWVYLVEKAFAKLNRNYENLDGGSSLNSFIDLTGGNSTQYDLKTMKMDVDQVMNCLKLVHKENWFVNCSSVEKDLGNGIPPDHAYTILNIDNSSIEIYDSLHETIFKNIPSVKGVFKVNFEEFMENFANFTLCFVSDESYYCTYLEEKEFLKSNQKVQIHVYDLSCDENLELFATFSQSNLNKKDYKHVKIWIRDIQSNSIFDCIPITFGRTISLPIRDFTIAAHLKSNMNYQLIIQQFDSTIIPFVLRFQSSSKFKISKSDFNPLNETIIEGEWKYPVNGGSQNYGLEKWMKNPQFKISFDKKCYLSIFLKSEKEIPIAFTLFKENEEIEFISVGSSFQKEIFHDLIELDPKVDNPFIIMPCTLESGKNSKFMICIVSELNQISIVRNQQISRDCILN
jgi:hypothetical protein